MQIYGPGPVHGPQSVNPSHLQRAQQSQASQPAALPKDEVQLSEMGQMLDGISQIPDIRQERVDQIRQQIAQGTYDTPERLGLALDNLLDEMI
ncbi:Negative regulator of flagellin synthesis FlgM [Planctomycetales bacterium 10988]|nr:Negative regulator of flagellin synthesis FlgM [Planctomycetales bacterium 10988]